MNFPAWTPRPRRRPPSRRCGPGPQPCAPRKRRLRLRLRRLFAV